MAVNDIYICKSINKKVFRRITLEEKDNYDEWYPDQPIG